MFRVTKPAEDCNANLTANTQNNAAFNESISDGNILVRGGDDGKDKTHGFSKTLAEIKNKKGESLGWHAAIILRYLSAMSRKYGKAIEGKRWVRVNLDHISEQYPYMGRSTVDDNILRLEQFGCCEKQNGVVGLKRRKNDRTRCYHVPKKWMDAAEEEPRYFNSSLAEQLNVPSAVVHYNFRHWIGECEEREVEARVKLSPATLVELLPFSESTIKRCLKTLEAEHYIQPVPGKTCWYAENIQESRGPNPDDKGSNPDEKGPNPDDKGSDPDNYMYCSNIIDELENSSKTKPAALVLVNADDVMKAADDKIHLLHDGITPYADEQDRKEMRHGEIHSDDLINPSSEYLHDESGHGKVTSRNSEIMNSVRERNEIGKCFSPFDTPSSPHQINSPVSSTAHMADAVENVNSQWPQVNSLAELHRINQGNLTAVEKLTQQPDAYQKLRDTVLAICAKTMCLVPPTVADELYDDPDGDVIVTTLLPYFHQFLDHTQLTPSDDLFSILYYGSLECMVGAFLWPRDNKNSYSHPLHSLVGITYELHLVLWRRAENLREHAIKEEFDQWRHEYASVDEDKENDADLSPAEKTRVFRNALNARNKIGLITFEQKHATHLIKITKLGLQRIQNLFELNPDLTPADLLPIMDGCMNKYSGRPAPPKKFMRGMHWHARMGHKLHIFASYLETIVTQLEMTSPVEVYLSDKPTHEDDVALAA